MKRCTRRSELVAVSPNPECQAERRVRRDLGGRILEESTDGRMFEES